MDMFVIEGGRPLCGTVRIGGSKNAALPLMCAALLSEGTTVIENVPDLRDVRSMRVLLEHLNVRVEFQNNRLTLDPKDFDTAWVPYDMMRKMRASMYAFGPMIARLGRAAVSKPGGCNIGSRPIDLHLKGFRALGVEMNERQGYVHARHQGLQGCEMSLLGPNGTSVGATCNVLMAAVLAEGRTVIHDSAREPEVQELARFLAKMGAQIEGIGTQTLVIEGVRKLEPVEWRLLPDRIETGTYAMAALITDGDLLLDDVEPEHLTSVIWNLRLWGAEIDYPSLRTMRVRRAEHAAPRPLQVTTEVYPGFPTDLQPQLVALLGLAAGRSAVRETIFQDRFTHIEELNRLGATMRRQDDLVEIEGAPRYDGAAVMASDLRGGAALILAALAAHGESQVRRIYHVERGYERIEQKLAAVGALIKRVQEAEDDPGLAEEWSEQDTAVAPQNAQASA